MQFIKQASNDSWVPLEHSIKCFCFILKLDPDLKYIFFLLDLTGE